MSSRGTPRASALQFPGPSGPFLLRHKRLPMCAPSARRPVALVSASTGGSRLGHHYARLRRGVHFARRRRGVVTAPRAYSPRPRIDAGTREPAALRRRDGSTYMFRGPRRAGGAPKAFFGRFECPRTTFSERRQLPNTRCSARRGGRTRRRRLAAALKSVVFWRSLNWSASINNKVMVEII